MWYCGASNKAPAEAWAQNRTVMVTLQRSYDVPAIRCGHPLSPGLDLAPLSDILDCGDTSVLAGFVPGATHFLMKLYMS